MTERSRRYQTEATDGRRAVTMNGAARTIEMHASRSQQRRRRHDSAMFSGNGNRTEDNRASSRVSRTMTEQAGQHDEDPLPIAADEKPDHDAGATALTIEDHRRDSAAGGGL